MSLLTVHKLTKSFGGVHAVDHVDLSFEEGKITALIGPNGSGKTTLINTITGMLPMDGGEVVINSEHLQKVARSQIARLGITRTFQNIRLIQQISVLDNVLLALTERSVWKSLLERTNKLQIETAENILKEVGLFEKRNENAEKLSYGQRKLLEIARALATRLDSPSARQVSAKIYFFDEPFAGLFPEMRKTVSEILRQLRDGDAAVVLIEHDMTLIRDLADYCYVLDSGKVIAEGTPEKVLAEPHVVEAYLGK